MEKLKGKVLKELFIHDAFAHYSLWPLIILSIILFFNLPQSLKLILVNFLGAISIICLPFALYRISNAFYLVKIGIEIIANNISVEHGLFGTKLKFEYEYAGKQPNQRQYDGMSTPRTTAPNFYLQTPSIW